MIITEIRFTLWCDAGDHAVEVTHEPVDITPDSRTRNVAIVSAMREGWNLDHKPTCPECVRRQHDAEMRQRAMERRMFGDDA